VISHIAVCRVVEFATNQDGTHSVRLVTASPPYMEIGFTLDRDTLIKLEIDGIVEPARDFTIARGVTITQPPRVVSHVADIGIQGGIVKQDGVNYTWKIVGSPYGEGFDECGNRIEER
jgi:hypothetical protein